MTSQEIISSVIDQLPILEYIRYEQTELEQEYGVIAVASGKITIEKLAETFTRGLNRAILEGIADAESCRLDEVTLLHDPSTDGYNSAKEKTSLSTRLALRVKGKIAPVPY